MNVYWTDLHSNLHSADVDHASRWFEHARRIMDFWAIAYYPYALIPLRNGFKAEGVIDVQTIDADWQKLADLTQQATQEGFPVFMGYEWQGNGADGDHNVFFKDQGYPVFPDRYETLKELVMPSPAIAIPHHMAYQPRFRGKNWHTHDSQFSPFAEVFSSHGSGEDDPVSLPMERHVHMGPRTGVTGLKAGLECGFPIGIIASGDNHTCPGVHVNGAMAVWAPECSKDALWEAMVNRRVYGVSRDHIRLDFHVDEAWMGSNLDRSEGRTLRVDVEGTDRIDRIEILSDRGRLALWSPDESLQQVSEEHTLRVEFGWGPDRRIFPECVQQVWDGTLHVEGTITQILPCFNHFDQRVNQIDSSTLAFSLISTKQNPNDRWMGVGSDLQEGFVVRLKMSPSSHLVLTVNGHRWIHTIETLCHHSVIHPFLSLARQRIADQWGDVALNRRDAWWHNAPKVKLHRAWSAEDTQFKRSMVLPEGLRYVRVNVVQVNGSVAWSSPIFFSEGSYGS